METTQRRGAEARVSLPGSGAADQDHALALQLQRQFELEEAVYIQKTPKPKVPTPWQIQCPVCDQWIVDTEAETHTNLCLDQVIESADRENAVPPPPATRDPVPRSAFDCPICTDTISPGHGYSLSCSHSYCGECLAGYYKTLIMSGKVLEMKCPDPACFHMCTSAEIRFVSPDDVYSRYLEFSRIGLLARNPHIKWCPNPGCDTPVERATLETLLMQCPTCDIEFCFSCSKAFHPNKTCDQASRFSFFGGKDLRVVLWEKLNTKPCPSCSAPIQKSKGCNHMTCGNCGHNFCWQCMKPYTDDHFEETGCTMYERSAAVFYLKAIGRSILRTNTSSDSSSDDESILEKLDNTLGSAGEKLQDMKDDLSLRWEATKEDLVDTFDAVAASAQEKLAKFKSFFSKRH